MRDPIAFQGRSRRSYFEGWYFKHVTPGGQALSVIPGQAWDADGAGHAFVQVIRGSDGATGYQRFSIDEFSARDEPFQVQVGANRFALDGVSLDLPEVLGGVTGTLSYRNLRRAGPRPLRPGIMGWYRYVPGMECYHELGSVDHELTGTLTLAGETVDFSEGRGYLEKDWGRSMPEAWIWMQCNGFPAPADGVPGSFMLSVATIPWLGSHFTGFLGYLAPPPAAAMEARRRSGRVLRSADDIETFGTWSGARIAGLQHHDTTTELTIRSRHWQLQVRAGRTHTGSLAAPVAGAMDRRIAESIDGTIELRWSTADGSLLWEGAGAPAGIEVVGSLVLPGLTQPSGSS